MDYLILGICILICILVVFLLVALMFCNYMIDRNDLVYNFRMTVFTENPDIYEKLSSYDTMMSYFWISLYDLDNWIDFKYPECGGIFQAIRNYINYKN